MVMSGVSRMKGEERRGEEGEKLKKVQLVLDRQISLLPILEKVVFIDQR